MKDQLTLFAVDTLAKVSLLPGSEKARKMTVGSGLKCSIALKNTGPVGSLAKMLLATSTWSSTMCFLTWKVRATPQKRLLFQLVPSMPRTEETEFGLWPTPRANEVHPVITTKNQHALANRNKGNLEEVVAGRMWPTPCAHEARLGYQRRSADKRGTQKSLTTIVIDDLGGREKVFGQLNPEWVEWLMGFPIGHTDLKHLEMQ